LTITNATYFTLYKWGKEGVFVNFFVNGHALDKQCFLEMAMDANSETIMKEDYFVNPIT
jgi:hypothetical protein